MSAPLTPRGARELDQKIAIALMGWGWVARGSSKWLAPLSTIGTDDGDPFGPFRAARADDTAEDSWWLRDSYKSFADLQIVPHYSTDIAAARLVEEEIERRSDVGSIGGLHVSYMCALAHRVGFPGFSCLGWTDLWRYVRATPEQRCLAALDALEKANAAAISLLPGEET